MEGTFPNLTHIWPESLLLNWNWHMGVWLVHSSTGYQLGGWPMEDWIFCDKRLPRNNFMHIGSNDLTDIADSQATCWVIAFGLKLHSWIVVFNLGVPRDSHNMIINADTFLQCMTTYNAKPRHELDQYKALNFNHLCGFYKMKVNNQNQVLLVASWTTNGIDHNQYMLKYFQHTCFAILRATTSLG